MLTLVQAQKLLVNALKEQLAATGRSTETDTPNPDLNGPLWDALELFGITPADPSAVSDQDLARFDDSLNRRFIDAAELRFLETALTALMAQGNRVEYPDYKVQRDYQMQWFGDLIKERRAAFAARYNQADGPAAGSGRVRGPDLLDPTRRASGCARDDHSST